MFSFEIMYSKGQITSLFGLLLLSKPKTLTRQHLRRKISGSSFHLSPSTLFCRTLGKFFPGVVDVSIIINVLCAYECNQREKLLQHSYLSYHIFTILLIPHNSSPSARRIGYFIFCVVCMRYNYRYSYKLILFWSNVKKLSIKFH